LAWFRAELKKKTKGDKFVMGELEKVFAALPPDADKDAICGAMEVYVLRSGCVKAIHSLGGRA
jgi:hypothetical protein